jgi:hypothetical protein
MEEVNTGMGVVVVVGLELDVIVDDVEVDVSGVAEVVSTAEVVVGMASLAAHPTTKSETITTLRTR